MSSDPRLWFWWCWGIVALGVAWFIALAIDADGLYELLGDASHAITFIAIFLTITALVVSLLFRRFIRVRDELVSGRGARARWRVSPEMWAAFAGHAERDIHEGHNAVLITILAFDVVICAGLAALKPNDAMIFFWIGLGIAAVGGVGWLLGRWTAAGQLTYRTGEVILGDRGMLVNGALHVWDYFGSQLDGIELIETETPRRLAVTYSFLTRTGRQYATAYAPVPDDEPDLAALLSAPRRPKRSPRRRRNKTATPAA